MHNADANRFAQHFPLDIACDAATLFRLPSQKQFHKRLFDNSILVSGLCGSNLHSAWDTCLVLKAVGEDVGEAATELLKNDHASHN